MGHGTGHRAQGAAMGPPQVGVWQHAMCSVGAAVSPALYCPAVFHASTHALRDHSIDVTAACIYTPFQGRSRTADQLQESPASGAHSQAGSCPACPSDRALRALWARLRRGTATPSIRAVVRIASELRLRSYTCSNQVMRQAGSSGAAGVRVQNSTLFPCVIVPFLCGLSFSPHLPDKANLGLIVRER